jgi:hypothetical protein
VCAEVFLGGRGKSCENNLEANPQTPQVIGSTGATNDQRRPRQNWPGRFNTMRLCFHSIDLDSCKYSSVKYEVQPALLPSASKPKPLCFSSTSPNSNADSINKIKAIRTSMTLWIYTFGAPILRLSAWKREPDSPWCRRPSTHVHADTESCNADKTVP